MQEIVSKQDPTVDQDLLEDSALAVPTGRNSHWVANDPNPPAKLQAVRKDQILQDRNLRKSAERHKAVAAHKDPIGPYQPVRPSEKQMIQSPLIRSQESASGFVSFEEPAAHETTFDHGSDLLQSALRECHIRMGKQENLAGGGPRTRIQLTRPTWSRFHQNGSGIGPDRPVGAIA